MKYICFCKKTIGTVRCEVADGFRPYYFLLYWMSASCSLYVTLLKTDSEIKEFYRLSALNYFCLYSVSREDIE